MTKETRKHYGKLWKMSKTSGPFEAYYKEFQEEIDAELEPKEPEVHRGRPKKEV